LKKVLPFAAGQIWAVFWYSVYIYDPKPANSHFTGFDFSYHCFSFSLRIVRLGTGGISKIWIFCKNRHVRPKCADSAPHATKRKRGTVSLFAPARKIKINPIQILHPSIARKRADPGPGP
jgi:hypothetical protein